MKINPNQVSKALDVYKNQSVKGTRKAGTAQNTDRVEISPEAQNFQKIFQAVKNSADVRMDKVQEIKRRIESGNYNVSSGDIADKILEGILFDKKI